MKAKEYFEEQLPNASNFLAEFSKQDMIEFAEKYARQKPKITKVEIESFLSFYYGDDENDPSFHSESAKAITKLYER